MKLSLLEQVNRSKTLMGLEDNQPSNVSVSKDGTVNFWDLESKKVYRYKLIASAKVGKEIPIEVKSINIENGTIEYVDPETEEIKVERINEESKNNSVQKYKNGSDIENLHTLKHKGFTVTIKLKFVEAAPLNIK